MAVRALARTALWGVLGFWLASGAPPVHAAPGPGGPEAQLVAQKLSLARRLLERWQASGQAEPGRAERIVEALQAAEQALDAGNLRSAGKTVDVALKRLARSASRTGCSDERRERLEHRYRKLDEGVRSFHAALERVAEEKGDPALAALGDVALDESVAFARALAGAGFYEEASQELAPVYEDVSRALARARANETIEHRLVFESAEQEYAYEQERYRSHLMLVDLAFQQREPDAWTRDRVREQVAASDALKEQADAQAGRGDYGRALKTLEEATGGLVRAVRQAGLALP
ncbi:MAG: hypothetical protein PVF91_09890 [Chromatiales bacterium]|jgi:hypothetical protein